MAEKEDSLQGVTGSRVMTEEDSPLRVTSDSFQPPSHFSDKGADFDAARSALLQGRFLRIREVRN